jgi:tRNA A-37 threonylcarbamoyl transferase component Bud32
MKEIDELVKKSKKYKKAIVQKNFKSKKNTVAYVTMKDKPRVLKWFVPGLKRQMLNEYKILNNGAKKLQIPPVYEMDEENNVLILDYLIGENLCDLINSNETSFSEKQRLIILLAEWYIDFHNFFKTADEFRIHGDPSLRNFVFSDRIWGVDFEESRTGVPSEDIAGTCASILTTDPMFTKEKFKLCKVFIDAYLEKAPGRILNINDEISYSLLEKIQWRPDDEEILRKYSRMIKESGIE